MPAVCEVGMVEGHGQVAEAREEACAPELENSPRALEAGWEG